jgi:histone-lysine N-methyltransferase SETMAR
MDSFVPNKRHLREVLLFCFNQKKKAAESYRLLQETYGEHAPTQKTCERWFQQFREGIFDVEDAERPGQPKKFEDEELEQLLDEDSCQTQSELASALNVDRSTVAKRLQAMGMIRKVGSWVPHELKERDVERRKTICEILLERQKRKGFLHRIVTGDEKWIYYENPKRNKAWVKPGEPGPSQPKRNIHCAKVMLCIWWDMKGVVYFELLQPSETITGDVYRRQLMRLKREIEEKRPEWVNRHNKLIFQHDNARPHVAQPVKNYLEGQNWEVLPHPPYSPDIAPSDYHLFRTMQTVLSGERFRSREEIKIWLDNWIASKDQDFFTQGIRKLPERWANVVASDGAYFE